MTAPAGDAVPWAQILEHWTAVEADLHQFYGIDLGDRAMVRARSWRWLKTRIAGLFDDPRTRLFRALSPRREEQPAWPSW